MKNINFLLVVFLVLFNFQARAESTIAYVDLKIVMNKSKPGIFIKDKIKNSTEKFDKKFSSIAVKLKDKENNLLKKKNLIEQKEFENKITELKSEIDDYNLQKKKSEKELRDTIIQVNANLLKKIEPILVDYAVSKKISILLQKKNIILGSKEFDVTNDIVLIVNEKISINDFK